MVVSNNFNAVSKLGKLTTPVNNAKKENKLATGQKAVNDDAASLQISSDSIRQKMNAVQGAEDIAAENMLSSESSFMDIAKAEAMISRANSNILDQADDAVKVQSEQSMISVMELLK